MATQGDSGLGISDFLLLEAECSDHGSDAEASEAENVEVDFISTETVEQGNSLEVFQALSNLDSAQQTAKLKRRLVSVSETPETHRGALSPLDTNCIPLKRQLFAPLASSSRSNEAVCASPRMQVDKENLGGATCQIHSLLHSSNLIASLLARFKNVVGIGWREVTREFKSNKSTTSSWVVACFDVLEHLYESSCELLKNYCDYLLCRRYVHERYNVCMYLCDFNVAKCKTTVFALFKTLVGVEEKLILAEPPKIRSPVCAMYWFKSSLTQGSFKHGTPPEWLAQQTILGHKAASQPSKFDLAEMIQWAYDNNYLEASEIAYNYAMEANNDPNAAAWLASTSQAKYVKDVQAMVSYYKRAELCRMSMSEYLWTQCQKVTENGSWLPIMNLLQFQGIEPILFVTAMKDWLRGTPKKNTIFIIGVPNTGKSMLTNSLISFMNGSRLSYAMSRSTFWMQPLATCKAALIDDATAGCLNFFDSHLRNLLDGYNICIDRKFKNPVEIKAPPLLVTTNIDITKDPRYFYLRSRAVCFHFENVLPLDENGNPVFHITHANWANFFTRLWARLGLEEQENSQHDGDRALNISSRDTNGPD